ncbi:MAG TPA: hypothetical protein PLS49_09560 [Candidatus Woesebacteria bacterium]|nr:hypothetical protein [Candidatus Woesebacteria bacterium]
MKNYYAFVIILWISATVLVLAVIGNPFDLVDRNYDKEIVKEIRNISENIKSHYRQKSSLPFQVDELDYYDSDSEQYRNDKTGKHYEYQKLDEFNYKICTDFPMGADEKDIENDRYYYFYDKSEVKALVHDEGYDCLEFEVLSNPYDPYYYKPQPTSLPVPSRVVSPTASISSNPETNKFKDLKTGDVEVLAIYTYGDSVSVGVENAFMPLVKNTSDKEKAIVFEFSLNDRVVRTTAPIKVQAGAFGESYNTSYTWKYNNNAQLEGETTDFKFSMKYDNDTNLNNNIINYSFVNVRDKTVDRNCFEDASSDLSVDYKKPNTLTMNTLTLEDYCVDDSAVKFFCVKSDYEAWYDSYEFTTRACENGCSSGACT